jgi:dienelactone hydrolase
MGIDFGTFRLAQDDAFFPRVMSWVVREAVRSFLAIFVWQCFAPGASVIDSIRRRAEPLDPGGHTMIQVKDFVLVAGLRAIGYVSALGFLLVLAIESSGAARATGLLFEDTKVPANYPQVEGAPTWSLEAVVVRADDAQRHPLAVFIDGTPETNPRPMLYVARELARRGWTTVAVMRPGYGTSEGKEPSGDYVSRSNFAAETLRETLRVMGQMSYIDPSRAIVIGHSTGGLGAVALTATPPATLVAAISFSGNIGSQYYNGKLDTVSDPAGVLKAFETFGHVSRVPMLWIYAENDHHMGPTLAQAYYKTFTDAGGKAIFHMAPATAGTDGHQLYSMPDELPIWTPYLDQFLSDQHLALRSPPLTVTLPRVTPPAGLTASGRQAFATYLAALPHKAFAMNNSHWGSAWLADSTAVAEATALKSCKNTDSKPCKIVMIDDKLAP